jgi:hypothetical protein
MRRLALLLATLAMSIGAGAQGIMHGKADPRTLTPTPNCGLSRFFVDDSTQKMYIAAAGSPCSWIDAAASGVSPDGSDDSIQTKHGAALAGGVAKLNATTGKLSASVNSQINPMMYGATGDCVTDDHDAITAAFRASDAYATSTTLPATVVFPKPPGGCYLTSTFTWYGESFQGQSGGIGDLAATKWPVKIKGMPGQDVLQAPDPSTSASIFPWWHSWTIRDITLQVVDGTNSFPHRWPGKWFDDVTTTNGSPVISTIAGELSCGDTGQAIKIAGAGASGADLVTTIASISPCWATPGATTWQVVTLAANAQATLTNAHTYVSVLGLPVTTTIGNCAIAAPMMNALVSSWPQPTQDEGMNNDVMENVTFDIENTVTNQCGMFTQGNTSPYQMTARNINFKALQFGVVQGSAELNSYQASSGNDFQIWDHVWMFGPQYPWISYNGGGNVLSNWQLSTSSGPQILQLGNVVNDCACGWNIGTGGFEIIGTNTGYGERIEGSGHFLNSPSVAGPGTTAQINANQSWGNIGSSGGSIVVGASNLTVTVGGLGITASVTDNGRGNKISAVYNGSGGLGGQQNNYYQTLIPLKGDSQTSGRATANNLRDGNYATPYNWDDLLIWPQDWVAFPTPGFNLPYSSFYVVDAASPSGAELILDNNNQPNTFGQFGTGNSFKLKVGTNIPAGKVIVYYMAKCVSGVGSFTLNIKTSTNAVPASDTESCSTTLQAFHFVADLTSYSGQSLGIIANTSTKIYLAWIQFMPYQTVNGLPVVGAGASVVTGPSTSTLHDCPWFLDVLGTIGDSGGGCVSGSGTGSSASNGTIPIWTGPTAQGNGPLAWASGVLTLSGSSGFGFTISSSSAGQNQIIKSTLASSSGVADLYLDEGASGARASTWLRLLGTAYWNYGLNGSTDYKVIDEVNGHSILDFPNNTMPASSLGGNANGATAITQSTSDNTTNIATDAFVHSVASNPGPATVTTLAEFSLGTCITAATVNAANGNRQKVTLTNGSTCALTFTQPSSGTMSITLKVTQSAVSSFNGGISGCKWPGGVTPTITQTTGAVDFVSIYLDGTNAYCVVSPDFR